MHNQTNTVNSAFLTYSKVHQHGQTDFTFHPSQELLEVPISTPFTFAFQENSVMLAEDKNGWWNPLGGHIENSETWIEALKREALEEAGVIISDIVIVGYILAKNSSHPKYPELSQLPITYSKIDTIVSDWTPLETHQRQLCNDQACVTLLSERDDEHQMLRIFEYVQKARSHQSLE